MDTQSKGLAAHRLTIGALAVLAVSGWGAFTYASLSGASVERQPQSQTVAGTETATPSQRPDESAAQTAALSNVTEPAAAAVTGSVKAAETTPNVEQATAPVVNDMPASVKVAEASLQPVAEAAPAVSLDPKRININTASAEELNSLGRYATAIMSRRPYKNVNELLSKKVLTRSAFTKIKDQITVN